MSAELPDAAIEFAHRLFDGARAGETAFVTSAVEQGVPVDLADEGGNTMLMLAAYHGHAGLTEALARLGADVNRLNGRGQSPLAGAVFKRADDVVAVLLRFGADPDAGTPSARATAEMFGAELPGVAPARPAGEPDVLHYAAFAAERGGGNPAGVILDASSMNDLDMLRLAQRLGYSETAFLLPRASGAAAGAPGSGGEAPDAAPLDEAGPSATPEFDIRFFSPRAEVAFCGHATLASAGALAERDGVSSVVLHTAAGTVPVRVDRAEGGLEVSFTTASSRAEAFAEGDLDELLALLGWSRDDLAPDLPTGVACAGLRHPVVWAASRERLSTLDYDFAGLAEFMRDRDWGTVSLLFRESAARVHSRNAFPIGGVVEDPATGAAAAALGGFLRDAGLLPESGAFEIRQGDDMGRPCVLRVEAPAGGRVRVSGRVRRLDEQGA